jgi:hypothetical protein
MQSAPGEQGAAWVETQQAWYWSVGNDAVGSNHLLISSPVHQPPTLDQRRQRRASGAMDMNVKAYSLTIHERTDPCYPAGFVC